MPFVFLVATWLALLHNVLFLGDVEFRGAGSLLDLRSVKPWNIAPFIQSFVARTERYTNDERVEPLATFHRCVSHWREGLLQIDTIAFPLEYLLVLSLRSQVRTIRIKRKIPLDPNNRISYCQPRFITLFRNPLRVNGNRVTLIIGNGYLGILCVSLVYKGRKIRGLRMT